VHNASWQGGMQAVTLQAGQWQQVRLAPASLLLIYADLADQAHAELQVGQGTQCWTLQTGDMLQLAGNEVRLCATQDFVLMLGWLAPA